MSERDERTFPGREDEWKAFRSSHSGFLEQLPALASAANSVFRESPTPGPDVAFVSWMLVYQVGQDFQHLFLLASNGYGHGALSVLRTLFERVVVAHWLWLHPDETVRFLHWEIVHRGKMAQALLDSMGDTLDAERSAVLRAAIVEAAPLRDEFLVSDCKKCGTRRMSHTWSSVDMVSMAKAVPVLTPWLGPAYYHTLSHSHATASSLSARHKLSAGRFVEPPQRDDAATALQVGHLLFLIALELQADKTGIEKAALAAASGAFKGAWFRRTQRSEPAE